MHECIAQNYSLIPIPYGGGVVSDLFSECDRAAGMALYFIGPLVGPAVGPVMGGFITESIGIQYNFYVVAICGIAAIPGIIFMRESNAPVIRLRHEKTSLDLEKAATTHPAFTMSKWAYLWINLKRPIMIMTPSFICFILSLRMALIYGIYYLMFTTPPDLFVNVYRFSIGIGGLAYIGFGVGFISATIFGAKICDKTYLYLAAKNGGKGKPEMHVPAMIFGSLVVPVGLFWYGSSAQAKLHFIMPIIGTAIFGFGIMRASLAIQLYLVDTFTYAASAVAAASVSLSILQMFAALGYGGGNLLLADLAIVLGIPFPIWIYYAGERMRARSSLTR
ncbi:major facilitator superfamily domain-containing protein [Suillus discolor]|uniref:Major facilitator superfamily domain-containing protein n=1 Tax=Suillus discolor TaxID=1912936 RepID=A0A9P7EWZ3_9AGAM|nr:major facilitator superfamily domain-containing protein [Suillus discolor]KAG2093738.1 major facilitator superfamily domain-containing protein [Suillus discolor]